MLFGMDIILHHDRQLELNSGPRDIHEYPVDGGGGDALAGGGGGGGCVGGDPGGVLVGCHTSSCESSLRSYRCCLQTSVVKNFLHINGGQILEAGSKWSLHCPLSGGGRVVVVVIVEVVVVNVGSEESDCDFMRSITGVVIGGKLESAIGHLVALPFGYLARDDASVDSMTILCFLPWSFLGVFHLGVDTDVVGCAFNSVSEKTSRSLRCNVVALFFQVMDGLFGELTFGISSMNTVRLLLHEIACSKVLPVSEESLYGLNKLFPNPFSIVDVGAMSDTSKNLKHRVSWHVISSCFLLVSHVDHRQMGSPCLIECIDRRAARIVIIGWSDIESISENIFVQDSRNRRRMPLIATKYMVFFNFDLSNREDRIPLRLLYIKYAVTLADGHPFALWHYLDQSSGWWCVIAELVSEGNTFC
ncbi:hypothetical protein Tco_1555823 [Tanacetum coccineum]